MTDMQFKRFEKILTENAELKAKIKELEEKLNALESEKE